MRNLIFIFLSGLTASLSFSAHAADYSESTQSNYARKSYPNREQDSYYDEKSERATRRPMAQENSSYDYASTDFSLTGNTRAKTARKLKVSDTIQNDNRPSDGYYYLYPNR